MHLVEGVGGPLDIVLSGNGRLDHGPFNGRCKARNWKTLISLFPVLHFKACPSVRLILHTVGQRSLHLSLIMMVRQGLFLLPFLLTRWGSDPQKGGGSQLNISTIGGNFPRIRSPILVHPGWLWWLNYDLVWSCRVRNNRFVTVLMG
jgi:hypothetical protein